jgi:hypothetical protein
MMVTAITLLDRKWPHLTTPGEVLFRAHVGRSDDNRADALSDEELTERVTRELKFMLGRFGPVRSSMVQRWPSALPQYHVGHAQLVAHARRAAKDLRVALCGMAYDGVGIPAGQGGAPPKKSSRCSRNRPDSQSREHTVEVNNHRRSGPALHYANTSSRVRSSLSSVTMSPKVPRVGCLRD